MLGLAVLAWTSSVQASSAEIPSSNRRIAFPRDAGVIDARRDLGARGDGRTDDTEALQRGIDQSSGQGGPTRVLFIPNGVYLVSKTLVAKSPLGPWIYGESRDKCIIRLKSNLQGVNAVLRTHPNEKGPTSADWFMRNIRNLTIDVGRNPTVDGIRYYATNSGILQDVRVTGHGLIGINAGFLDQSGPNLVQDVTVDGFETGIQAQWIWGETLSRITIRNCRKLGIYVNATPVAIEDLVVENTPMALKVDYPNDWTWWGGVAALVNAKFTGGDPKGAAIHNRSVLFARNVRAKRFGQVLKSETPSGSLSGLTISEYRSHELKSAFDSPNHSLNLPIKREPKPAWELQPKRWVCANDFGAKPGDNIDDSTAIQAAIDAAASRGATTVYFRGIGGGDPNWYSMDRLVQVHGSVRHILGLGFGRILNTKDGGFVLDDRSASVVKFQNIDSFGGPPAQIIHRGQRNTLVVESCGVRVIGDGAGDIFLTDVPGTLELRKPNQSVWARQLNPEGDLGGEKALVSVGPGNLWALGLKSEGAGVRVSVGPGGAAELFGMFMYSSFPGGHQDRRPMFDIDQGRFSIAGLRELSFAGGQYIIKLRERQGSVSRELTNETEQGWFGWSLFRSGR